MRYSSIDLEADISTSLLNSGAKNEGNVADITWESQVGKLVSTKEQLDAGSSEAMDDMLVRERDRIERIVKDSSYGVGT